MRNQPINVRQDEETQERARHDKYYQEEYLGEPAKLVPSDWEKFDRPGGAGSAYLTSVRWLGGLDGKTVLDYGCGTGWFSVILAKRGASRVDAVDISGEAIEQAKATAQANAVADICSFTRGSCYGMPFEDETYDVVGGQAILHHLRDKEAAGRELHRVMRAGAKAIFYEPLGNSHAFEWFRQRLPFASDTDEADHWLDKITLAQLNAFRPYFQLRWTEFELLYGFSRYFNSASAILEASDAVMLKYVPGLKHFARGIVIELTKI